MDNFEFKSFLKRNNNLILMDGAVATELFRMGLATSDLPEGVNLASPKEILSIHWEYLEAGSKMICTNSFGASRIGLSSYGLRNQSYDISKTAAEIAKQASQGYDAIVAGAVGPTGEMLYPLGHLEFSTAVDSYRSQMRGLLDGGADIVLLETMLDVKEAEAAVTALKTESPLTAFAVSFTFDEKTLTTAGNTPEDISLWAAEQGACAVGANCGIAPNLYPQIIKRFSNSTDLPIIAYPNAGIPNTETHYDIDSFTELAIELIKNGANIIGGCCGTNPSYIKKIGQYIKTLKT